MWEFWERSGPVPLAGEVRLVLEKERGVSIAGAAGLRMIAQGGRDADRPVTFFRVFDPAAIAETDGDLRDYDDLDASLILHSGYIDRDGTIVLNGQPSPT
jgi:hypothetical protein